MSESRPQRHLDASQGREVVYCHACENEWYRDEQPALECPRCHGEITEIVSPENDPRDLDDEVPGHEPGDDHDGDSDPEEADIDQHIHHTGNGFFMHRTIRPGGAANHNDPQVDVLRRFTDMLNDFHPQTPPPGAQPTMFSQWPGATSPGQPGGEEPPMPAFTRTTFRASPFGTTRVTIHTIPVGRGGPLGFDTVFADLMNGPSRPSDPNSSQARQGQPQNPLDQMLQGLMAVFMGGPPGGVHGDAVYTQEALDRIITQLMEAQPHSSRAPPPASEEAIAKLGKRTVQIEDLGSDGKAECTICIDELHVGDEVTVLPCKHWFHGECVTLWLKEHNTCPICRTPIEASRNPHEGQTGQGQQQGQQQASQQENQQQGGARSQGGDISPSNPVGSDNSGHFWNAQAHQSPLMQNQYGSAQGPQDPAQSGNNGSRLSRYERLFRSSSGNEDRLNAIRNVAGANYRSPPPGQSPSSHQPQQSGVTQRRNSHSPPAEPATRSPRVRSPEHRSRDPYGEQIMSGFDADSYRRRERDSEGRRDGEGRGNGTGSGPLSWLRDQWSRHSGGGSNGGGHDSGSGPGSNDRRS